MGGVGRRRGAILQSVEHEAQKALEACEAQVLGQCRDVLVEHIAPWQARAQPSVALIEFFKDGVKQEREDVQRQEGRGEVLDAVTKKMPTA